MSLLTRTGTLVRKNRGSVKGSNRGSRRSNTSLNSSRSGSFRRQTDVPRVHTCTKTDQVTNDNFHSSTLPVRSFADVVLSFDDERQLVRTSVGWENHINMEGPPDYGALMYQINEARKESDNIVDFGCKTYSIICNTLLVTIIVGVLLACPIAMVSVGVKYLDDCPIEPRIPIYLLVGGCFGMIKLMSTLWRNIQTRRYQDVESVFDDNDVEAAFANTTYRSMDTILFLFLIGWQIAGTYWTAKIWPPNFEQILHEPSNWCDETVYMFSIYQQCFSYSVMLLWTIFLLLLMCCHHCCYSL
ncbi:hypothetical protein ACF0H5_011351 [Mactra antiquata]